MTTGLEPIIIAALAKSISDVIVKTLWDEGSIKQLFGMKIDDAIKNIIDPASKKYAENYYNRHGILKILGMREPITIEQIYTTVQLLSDREILRFASVEDLEKDFRKTNTRRFYGDKQEKKPGIEIARKKQYLTVLGQPGAGKSTFLRKIGLETLKGKQGEYQYPCIPVFLELKRFNQDKIDIKQIITEEFNICGLPEAEKFTDHALNKGKLLILLDGLDEVPSRCLNQIIEQIQDFVDKNDKNRFIISCRTAAYRSSFRRFSDVVIADFDDSQIEQFIRNWFNTELDKQAKTADQCWELLQKREYEAAKELAKTPLLLTFLCLVYDKSQNFPSNRSDLYAKALRILLEEWAAEKRVERDPIYEGLHTKLEEKLLAEIACRGFIKDRLFYKGNDLVSQINKFLADKLNAPENLDGDKVLGRVIS